MEKTELGIGPGIVRFLAGKCLRGSAAFISGKRGGLLAGVHVPFGSLVRQCGADGYGKHEPGAD